MLTEHWKTNFVFVFVFFVLAILFFVFVYLSTSLGPKTLLFILVFLGRFFCYIFSVFRLVFVLRRRSSCFPPEKGHFCWFFSASLCFSQVLFYSPFHLSLYKYIYIYISLSLSLSLFLFLSIYLSYFLVFWCFSCLVSLVLCHVKNKSNYFFDYVIPSIVMFFVSCFVLFCKSLFYLCCCCLS